MRSPLWRLVMVVVVVCAALALPSHAQQCVAPATFCEALWVPSQRIYIENPSCMWINHSFLQGDTFYPDGSSEGYRYEPAGSPCGVEENGTPCGVATTNDTCSEDDNDPTTCSPETDPTCLCDPADSSCSLEGGGCGLNDPGCDGCGLHPCADSVGLVLQRASETSPLPGPVNALLQELAHAKGIYLKARFALHNTAGPSVTAIYEYWERAGRYRIRLTPGGSYPFSDIAFDGTFTQGKSSSDTVEVQRGDNRLTPLPDGPLALALAPLRVANSTTCPMCQLRLGDLGKAITWRRGASSALTPQEKAIHEGTFDAGSGRTGEVDAQGRLVRLIWPADQNRHHLDVMLSSYQAIPGVPAAMFPMRLVENLTPTASVEYTVETIDLSPSFQDSAVFNLYSSAQKIIYKNLDGSSHRVVRRLPVLPLSTSMHR